MGKSKYKKEIKFLKQYEKDPIFSDMVDRELKRRERIYIKHRRESK